MADLFDRADLKLLRNDFHGQRMVEPGLPYAFRIRNPEEAEFWSGMIRSRDVQGPLCIGQESREMPWCLGHIWVQDDGDMFFIGLRRSPIFHSMEDGVSWLGEHPDGSGFELPTSTGD